MNKKLKAKLLIGIFITSGIILKTSTVSISHATSNEFESPSASEGVGDDGESTIPDEPTAQGVVVRTLDLFFNTLQRTFSLSVENENIERMRECLQISQLYGELYTPLLTGLENGWTLLHVAAIKNRAEEILRVLFFNGTIVENAARNLINNQDQYGRTPLHWAAAKHNHAAYNFLVQQGADQTILDRSGRRPDEYFYRSIQY